MTESTIELRPRPPLLACGFVAAALVVMTAAVVTGHGARTAAPLALLVVVAAVTLRRLLEWRVMIAAIVVIILFIPIKRYALPASLPIKLEPYRLTVAAVCAAWLTSALIDRRVRLRRTGLIDLPLLVFLLAIAGSELANISRVSGIAPDVVKALLFFASYIAVLYLVVSLLRSFEDIDFVVRVLTAGGTVVAISALVESRTGYNIFNHLSSVFPFLRDTGDTTVIERGARLRVFASSQHPIALSAALAMLVPLALYRAICFRQIRWWLAAIILTAATVATLSRTGILMLFVVLLVFVWLRFTEVKRLWPLALPALLAVHFILPGAIGTIRASFFPKGGLVAQQADAAVGSGRVATLGPALHNEFRPDPFLGEGFGTRITSPDNYVPVPNGPILDDQWLGTLLETGLVGACALLWLFVRFVRRVGKAAKHDRSPRGWLLVAITASVAAFAESMITYDAFSFIQVTFILFIMLGLGSAAYLLPSTPTEAPEPGGRQSQRSRRAAWSQLPA